MLKVFLDTNILILLSKKNVKLPPDAIFCTFEKNIYEFTIKTKKHLTDPFFVIRCIKGNQTSTEATMRLAHEIITAALKKMPFINKDMLVDGLKKYLLEFQFAMAKEHIYRSYEDLELLRSRYLKDDDMDKVDNVDAFYDCVYREWRTERSRLTAYMKENNMEIFIYQQVFSNDAEGYSLQEHFEDATIPPEDLEIVLSAIKMGCDLFLSCDKKLIRNTLSLGLNHCTTFILCDDSCIEESIEKIVCDYAAI